MKSSNKSSWWLIRHWTYLAIQLEFSVVQAVRQNQQSVGPFNWKPLKEDCMLQPSNAGMNKSLILNEKLEERRSLNMPFYQYAFLSMK